MIVSSGCTDYQEISEAALLTILKEPVIIDASEVELWELVKCWVRQQCIKRGVEVNGPNMRQAYFYPFTSLYQFKTHFFLIEA